MTGSPKVLRTRSSTPARAVLASATALAAASALSLGAPAAGVAVGAAVAAAGRPTTAAPGESARLRIDPRSITAGSPDLTVRVSSTQPLSHARVTLSSTGGARVDRRPHTVGRTTTPSRLTVGARVPSGFGTITATLHGVSASGAKVVLRSTVYVDSVAGRPIASVSGELVKLRKIALRHRLGLVDATTAHAQRLAVLGATHSTQTLTHRATCSTVCISGVARWTDHAGGTHAIPSAAVGIFAKNPSPPDQLLAKGITGANGSYSATVAPAGRNVYVRIYASGPGFVTSSSVTGYQYIESDLPAPANGTAAVVNFTATNDESMDNNVAFSVENALTVANQFVVDMNGKRFPNVKVDFPNLAGGSYFAPDEGRLYIDPGDRWDWDPTLHEFGHYVMDELKIQANPGEEHSFDDNESDVYHSKKIGLPLAWGEAWPTYFSLSLQQYENAGALNIPNVGDSVYQDTEDQDGEFDPEAGRTLGEDNEGSILAILWDLYDAPSDGLDHVHLGAKTIWNKLKGSNATTFSAAYKALAPGDTSDDDPVNCVSTQYNISPTIAGGLTRTFSASAASPKVTWTAGNGGTHKNNAFIVQFHDAGNTTVLASSPKVTSTSFTLPADQWTALKEAADGTVEVTVVGAQTDTPASGPYRSCAQAWTISAS